MSAQTTTTSELPTGTAPAEKAPRALRLLGLAAVCIGVAALAAATFVLSYSGIKAVVLQAGITPRYAKGYPLLLDAMLVVVLAAVLSLRGAGLPSKILAWLALIVVLAAAAGADAMHAAGHRLPHQPAAITAAVLPFALVFLAFLLLLTMLRHARLRRLAAGLRVAPHGPARAHWQPGEPGSGQPGSGQLGLSQTGLSQLGLAPQVPGRPAVQPPAPPLPAAQLHAAQPPATQPPAEQAPAEQAPAEQAPAAPAPAETSANQASEAAAETGPEETRPAAVIQPMLAVPRQAGRSAAADADPGFPGDDPAQVTGDDLEHATGGDPEPVTGDDLEYATGDAFEAPDLADEADLALDDPSTDEGVLEPAAGSTPYPVDSGIPVSFEPSFGHGDDSATTAGEPDALGAAGALGEPEDAAGPGEAGHSGPDEAGPDEAGPDEAGPDDEAGSSEDSDSEESDPDMPVFHRVWSSPTPPPPER